MDAYIKNPTASNLYNSTADAIDKEWSSDTCEEFESMLAVHFSHHSMHLLHIEDMDTRPEEAKSWIGKWKSACKTDLSELS